MDENETVETDYAATIKEAVVKGAVSALASIAVTYAFGALMKRVQSRRSETVEAVAVDTE